MKNSRNRIISFILASIMLISNFAFADTFNYGYETGSVDTKVATFSDVSAKDWFYGYINESVRTKVVSGYPDGSFRPNKDISRAEFSKILANSQGYLPTTVSAGFADMVGHWAENYTNACGRFLPAYGANYMPSRLTTRLDAAVSIIRAKGFNTQSYDASILEIFSDSEAIPRQYIPEISKAVEIGLISGFSDGSLRIQAPLTRAMTCAIMVRSSGLGQYANPISPIVTPTPVSVVPSPTPVPTVPPVVVVPPVVIPPVVVPPVVVVPPTVTPKTSLLSLAYRFLPYSSIATNWNENKRYSEENLFFTTRDSSKLAGGTTGFGVADCFNNDDLICEVNLGGKYTKLKGNLVLKTDIFIPGTGVNLKMIDADTNMILCDTDLTSVISELVIPTTIDVTDVQRLKIIVNALTPMTVESLMFADFYVE